MAVPLLIVLIFAILVIIALSVWAASPPSDRTIERALRAGLESTVRARRGVAPVVSPVGSQTDGMPGVSVLSLILTAIIVLLYIPIYVVQNWDWFPLGHFGYALSVYYFSIPATCLALGLAVRGFALRKNPYTLFVVSLVVPLVLFFVWLWFFVD